MNTTVLCTIHLQRRKSLAFSAKSLLLSHWTKMNSKNSLYIIYSILNTRPRKIVCHHFLTYRAYIANLTTDQHLVKPHILGVTNLHLCTFEIAQL